MASPQLVGSGSGGFDTQTVYTEAGLAVGTFGVLEGRGFVWCKHTGSESLTRGEPLVTASINYTVQNLATSTNGLAIGQTEITGITASATAIAANAFEGGLLVVVDGGGEGTAYRIRDHTAFTASSADGRVILEDPIVIASDANTEVTFLQSKYADPQQSNAFGGDSFVGVPNVMVPAGDSTAQYFWAQRVGYCPVFVEGTPRRGISVMVSGDTDGRLAAVRREIAVSESKTGGGRTVHPLDQTPVVGQMVTDAIDGETQIVDLQNPLF